MEMIKRAGSCADMKFVGRFEGACDKDLGGLDRFRESQSSRHISSDRRGQCAAGPVRIAGRDAFACKDLRHAAVEIKVVASRGIEMAAFQEHGAKPKLMQPRRKPRYTLEELLAKCDFSQPMPPEDREWLDAPPVGRELL